MKARPKTGEVQPEWGDFDRYIFDVLRLVWARRFYALSGALFAAGITLLIGRLALKPQYELIIPVNTSSVMDSRDLLGYSSVLRKTETLEPIWAHLQKIPEYSEYATKEGYTLSAFVEGAKHQSSPLLSLIERQDGGYAFRMLLPIPFIASEDVSKAVLQGFNEGLRNFNSEVVNRESQIILKMRDLAQSHKTSAVLPQGVSGVLVAKSQFLAGVRGRIYQLEGRVEHYAKNTPLNVPLQARSSIAFNVAEGRLLTSAKASEWSLEDVRRELRVTEVDDAFERIVWMIGLLSAKELIPQEKAELFLAEGAAISEEYRLLEAEFARLSSPWEEMRQELERQRSSELGTAHISPLAELSAAALNSNGWARVGDRTLLHLAAAMATVGAAMGVFLSLRLKSLASRIR